MNLACKEEDLKKKVSLTYERFNDENAMELEGLLYYCWLEFTEKTNF